jgi:propionate CoA-transferase
MFSKFGPRLAGAGGFINISQSARKVVFVGSFCAGDCATAVENGRLRILRDGAARKFVGEVEHRTFAGRFAAEQGQEVLYVTERCVFRLQHDGLELIEVAPGVDVKRDILERMDFVPIVRAPRLMDARIFADEPMGLRGQMVALPFDARFMYDVSQNTLFINFEGFAIKSLETVRAVARKVESICQPLGKRVHAVVNYEGFEIDRDVEDAWAESVREIVERHYDRVTRYTTSAFQRAKLGDALARRKLAPHVFESQEEALAALRSVQSLRASS